MGTREELIKCNQASKASTHSYVKSNPIVKEIAEDMKKINQKSNRRKLCLLCLVLLTSVVSVAVVVVCVLKVHRVFNAPPAPCGQGNERVDNGEYLRSPLGPFTELRADEVEAVVEFLARQDWLRLRHVSQATLTSNFIHTIELMLPPKRVALHYLEVGGVPPARQAKVLIFMGNATPPVIEEYVVGDLPRPTFARLVNSSSRQTRIPYSYRPFSLVEFTAIYRHVLPWVHEKAGHILLESFGAAIFDCGERCLRFSMTPVSSAFLEKDKRKSWFWFAYNREFYTLNPLDFQILVDMTSNDPRHWEFQNVWYGNRLFDSMEHLVAEYDAGRIQESRVRFPSEADEKLYSSLHLRGDPVPAENLEMPRAFEPHGPRYKVRGNRVEYMSWAFTYRVSTTVGLQLFDVRFQNERILYELSMQEIAVLYTGHSPAASMLYFADSASLFGTRFRGLMPGVDCPEYATYVDTELYTSNENGLRRQENAICIFEQNTQVPLRRHRAYSRSGNFYGGLQDVTLVMRIIVSVINYDYVLDFIFHSNGAVEVRVCSTGYLSTSFYYPQERPYGTQIHPNVQAGLHHHLFHFKADVDVLGTENRFQTLEIHTENKTNAWSGIPGNRHTQTNIKKSLKFTEKEAAYQFNFDHPKYLLFSNGRQLNRFGYERSYRLQLKGISKSMIPPGDGFESSVPWMRYQMAVTRQRDDEATSGSIFTMWDASDPVVNFQSYIDDDEDIVDKDLVSWVTLGTHHIPQSENVPNTATVGGHLAFFLLPFNYHQEDPSMASRDALRVTPHDPHHPLRGAQVLRYREQAAPCLPSSQRPDARLARNSTFLFS